MKMLTVPEICRAVGGRTLSIVPEGVREMVAVCTDSRRMKERSLFIAIKGENHDGHLYLEAARQGGAVAAMVEDLPAKAIEGLVLIQVPNTRKAMGRLATHVRQQLRGKVIAVAGSNGKTGTKRLIHAALSRKLNGSVSPGSFNNDIGVPLTIFPADPAQDYLVLELGTNHPGEIRALTHMALPDIAVITNCSAEHMEFLIDLPTVRRENASIVEGMDPATGVLVVNGDDAAVLEAVSHFKGRKITFGFKESNELFATEVVCDESGVRFDLNGNEKLRFSAPLLGKHVASNALAAIAVAKRLGLSDAEIAAGLAEAKGPDKRLELERLAGGVTVLNDSFNANPASMKAALETLAGLKSAGRRIAVLADMLELGAVSQGAHQEAGELVAELRFDALVCVGAQARWIAQSAIARGVETERVSLFEDWEAAAQVVPRWLREGDLVLLKGSHGMKLEKLGEAIAASVGQEMRTA